MSLHRVVVFFAVVVALTTCVLGQLTVRLTTSNPAWSVRGTLYMAIAPNLTFTSQGTNSTVFWPTPTYLMTGRQGYAGNPSDDKLWPSNDVWASSDLVSWSLIAGTTSLNGAVVNSTAAYPYNTTSYFSYGQSCMGYSSLSNKWVRLGGQDSSNRYVTNAYMSSNASVWTLQSIPTFSGRVYCNLEFDSFDNLYLLGGYNGNGLPDVYMSTNYGVTWTVRTLAATYGRRSAMGFRTMTNQFNAAVDILVITSGWDGQSVFNDVWASFNQGVAWTRMSASAPWPTGVTQQLLTTSDNIIIVYGGPVGTVFASADIGVSWSACTRSAGWGYRWWPAMLIDATNKLILAGGNVEGGNPQSGWRNDIWQSTQSVSISNLIQFCGLNASLPSISSSAGSYSLSSSSSIPSQSVCSTSVTAGAYDLSSLSQTNYVGLSISKTFQYVMKLCSVVTETYCEQYAQGSALCQLTIPPISGQRIAIAGSGTAAVPMSWSFIQQQPALGVVGTIENGPICGAFSLPSLLAVFLVCDRQPPTNVFTVDDTQTTPKDSVCTYMLTLRTPLSCPSTVSNTPTHQNAVQNTLAWIRNNASLS